MRFYPSLGKGSPTKIDYRKRVHYSNLSTGGPKIPSFGRPPGVVGPSGARSIAFPAAWLDVQPGFSHGLVVLRQGRGRQKMTGASFGFPSKGAQKRVLSTKYSPNFLLCGSLRVSFYCLWLPKHGPYAGCRRRGEPGAATASRRFENVVVNWWLPAIRFLSFLDPFSV